MTARKRIRTLEQLAKACGVSLRTVQRWRGQGMPPAKRGSFNLDAIRAWNQEREAARRESRRRRPGEESAIRAITRTDRPPPDDDELDDRLDDVDPKAQLESAPRSVGSWEQDVDQQLTAGIRPRTIIAEQEARRRFWLAERERIAARKEAGELVPATEAQDRIVKLCAAFRRLFLDHCRRAAPLVVNIEDTLQAQRALEHEAEVALASIQQMGGVPA